MDRAPNAREKQILEEEGFRQKALTLFTWTQLRVKHAFTGCTKWPYWKMDQRLGKVVEVGRMCPVCWKEYPLER